MMPLAPDTSFAGVGRSFPAAGGWGAGSIQANVQAVPPGGLGYDSPYKASGVAQQDTAFWFPSRSSADGMALPAKDLTLARVRDVVRNDLNAKAAVERLVDLIVGSGFSLSARPDGMALGIEDPKVLRKFARSIQSEWRIFSQDPRRAADAQRKMSLNGLFRLFARTTVVAGECTYALKFRPLPGVRYATCVLPIDPDRLSNPNESPPTLTLRGGVETDADGVPVAYHIRDAHIGDYWAGSETATWTRVRRETAWGRPVFVHGFEPEREGQTRAMSPFASLIQCLRMVGKHRDAELATAAANALFAAFVETDLPSDEVAQRLTPSAPAYADRVVDHYTRHPPNVGGVRIPVMMPGSKITMNAAPRQTASFASFQTAFLQSIASALGISYEQLSMDWSRTNYSSARAALNEVWRSIDRARAIFVEQVVQPIYYAFLEEAIDKGFIAVPKPVKAAKAATDEASIASPPPLAPDLDDLDRFHMMPSVFMRARWIGPSRGIIDPLKEAEATSLELENLTTTFEKACAARGDDYEETFDQIALETQELKDRGISRLSLVAAVQPNKGPKPDSEEADGPAGAGGNADDPGQPGKGRS